MVANSITDIDLTLLFLLEKKPYTIMSLVKEIGLAHKNLLNHLNKLETMDIIYKERNNSTREIFIKPTPKGHALYKIHYRKVIDCKYDNKKNQMILKFVKL